ncbi:CDP-glucose 4,6-dehydratase [Aureibaculum luteum]|uniref:CDP-glucose 4,6-dehydratase n=1 Tax=Aureibaculum luteum TaxID=1548456 RepID=UPI000E4EAAD7|nr:CDP-glucose 4,6-dehydratase [Aureibaculum luteum]
MNLDFQNTYRGKKVLVTGNTGFKGSWLSQWLLLLNAEVFGYALEPPTTPSLFNQLQLNKHSNHNRNDVRDLESLKKCIKEIKPDIIFHLAAQSLVRESYDNPIETLETNINGTANVLEAVRQLGLSTNIVVITSDKCYENKEWIHGYRENDPMGGYDPYSMSKGAAELVVSSWRRSFFNINDYNNHGVKVASARAGNVIGGGDWADDRIVPDCMRSLQKNEEIFVRNPLATRPWQHVLESLGGYLVLGNRLLNLDDKDLDTYCSGFNFGPLSASNKTVEVLVKEILENWGRGSWTYKKEDARHEAFLLNLSIDKAYHLLNWQPVWNFKTTVKNTAEWYKNTFENQDQIVNITEKQITEYSKSLKF